MITGYLILRRLIAVYRFDYFHVRKYSIQHFCFSNKSLNRTRLLNFAFNDRLGARGLCGHVLTCRVRSGDIESDWEAFWSYDHYVIRAFLESRPFSIFFSELRSTKKLREQRDRAATRWKDGLLFWKVKREAPFNLFILERRLRFVQAMRSTWTSLRPLSHWCQGFQR